VPFRGKDAALIREAPISIAIVEFIIKSIA
jgi:hypothetical protein